MLRKTCIVSLVLSVAALATSHLMAQQPNVENAEQSEQNAQRHRKKLELRGDGPSGSIVTHLVDLRGVQFGVPQVVDIQIENKSTQDLRLVESLYKLSGQKTIVPENAIAPGSKDILRVELAAMTPNSKRLNLSVNVKCEGDTKRLDITMMTNFVDMAAFAVPSINASLPVRNSDQTSQPFTLRVPLILSDPGLSNRLQLTNSGDLKFEAQKIVNEGENIFAELTIDEALVPSQGLRGELVLQSPYNEDVSHHIPYSIVREQPIQVVPIEIVMLRGKDSHYSGKAFVRENSDYFNVDTKSTSSPKAQPWMREAITANLRSENPALSSLKTRVVHVNKGIHRLFLDIDLDNTQTVDKLQNVTLEVQGESAQVSVPVKLVFQN